MVGSVAVQATIHLAYTATATAEQESSIWDNLR
jgi:hypothetical protein